MPPPPIQILSEQLANQIAAGEVVERPASVVKETLENALDAGATEIEIEVVDGGRKLIRVADNGWGLGRDDALLAIERHATSKIHDIADLDHIATHGFRGEALAAIAAVARFTLTTRRAEDLGGTVVTVHGSKLVDVRETGCPVGTTIEVRNLFFNVPARRRFLRAVATELSVIRQVVLTAALAQPAVGFRLLVDGRELYRFPRDMSLAERLPTLFEPETVAALRPIDHQEQGIAVTGYVGLPTLQRGDRSGQYVFINRRPAGAPLIGFALREACEIRGSGRHPVSVLFIALDPERVDVNVHPTKREVRFRQPAAVRDAVLHAVQRALGKPVSAPAPPADSVPPPPPFHATPPPQSPATARFPYPRLPFTPPENPRPARTPAHDPPATTAPPEQPPAPPDAFSGPWTHCRIVGVLHDTYWVLETDGGMALLDPRAAHERVLFERLLAQAATRAPRAQGLLPPRSITLPPTDARCVQTHLDALRAFGFALEPFGADAFLVEALPSELAEAEPGPLLVDIARDLETQSRPRGRAAAGALRAQIARAACQAALRYRATLGPAEIETLVADLAQTEMPYTSPGGRPTLIFTSLNELHRKFGRRAG